MLPALVLFKVVGRTHALRDFPKLIRFKNARNEMCIEIGAVTYLAVDFLLKIFTNLTMDSTPFNVETVKIIIY